jgi:hypothetical protein
MATNMRAKMKVTKVVLGEGSDMVSMVGVGRSTAYPADGLDEDNTFAKFSPSVSLEITITNPALLGKTRPGEKFYVDFTAVE